jgi:predicted O-linked N-acetylglucosamine transferase (SPINDLY family)
MVTGGTLARLERGAEHHRAGRWDEAEQIYREILSAEPNEPDALYLLGTIFFQRGAWGSAQLFLRKAMAARPGHPETLNNLGLVQEKLGRWEEAEKSFTHAISLAPTYADAIYNLANIHRTAGRWEQAEEGYRRALVQRPGWGEALDNLGLTLRMLGRNDEARRACLEAINHSPGLVGPHLNLGAIAKSEGNLLEAARCFHQAVELAPRHASAHTNLGIILAQQKNLAAGRRECEFAVELDPTSATCRNNLGLVLFLLGEEDRAADEFRAAIAIDPSFGDAFNNLGSALYRLNDVAGALEAYRESVRLKESAIARKNLGSILEHACLWEDAAESFRIASRLRQDDMILQLRSHLVCPTVVLSTSQIDAYRESLTQTLAEIETRGIHQSIGDWLDADVRPSFAWQFHGRDDRPIRESLARIVARSFDIPRPKLRRSGKPTVGFLVAPGHEYAFVRSIGGMFGLFDRNAWRSCVVGSPSSEEKLRRQMGDALDFVPIPGDLEGMVTAIRQEPIDLVYHWEIATGAMNYLLPFCRPAPLQVTSWGIQVTSGISAVDYYLSSKWIEPDHAADVYTEKLVTLDTMLSYQRPMELPSKPLRRSDLGLPETGTIYLCAQQLGKFHPEFDPLIEKILSENPAGYLVTTRSPFEPENRRLLDRWSRTLASVVHRIILLPKQVGPAYASLMLAADVVLDPIHFGGVNTTYDALSAGRASVTWPSGLHRGRYTLGCFRRMDLLDTVAGSAEEYVSIALRLAKDVEYRRSVEASLIERRDVLFDCRSSAQELEAWMIETIENARLTGW